MTWHRDADANPTRECVRRRTLLLLTQFSAVLPKFSEKCPVLRRRLRACRAVRNSGSADPECVFSFRVQSCIHERVRFSAQNIQHTFHRSTKHRQSKIINNIIPTCGTHQYTSSRCHCLVHSSHVVVAVLGGHPMGREGPHRPAKLSQYC